MRTVGGIAIGLGLLIGAGAVGAWLLTAPQRLTGAEIAQLPPGDAERGERVFWAGGCASCHAAPDASGDEQLALGGGLELATDFGTFVAPNISPHTDGIGDWDIGDFANAMKRGVSPAGTHYYPAFPYASYARMTDADVADLFAFMGTLPPVEGEAADSSLSFPYNIRRGVGLWKRLNLDDEPIAAIEGESEEVAHGRYLVEGLGHCGECHTPRDALGGMDRTRWLAGAPALEGQGRTPNITPAGIGDWSEDDIAYYLESGFTPDFDSAGGRMAAVIRNLARLPEADRLAIAAYLKEVANSE